MHIRGTFALGRVERAFLPKFLVLRLLLTQLILQDVLCLGDKLNGLDAAAPVRILEKSLIALDHRAEDGAAVVGDRSLVRQVKNVCVVANRVCIAGDV